MEQLYDEFYDTQYKHIDKQAIDLFNYDPVYSH